MSVETSKILCVETDHYLQVCAKTKEMSAKKLGKIENQPGITTFVGTTTEKVKKTKLEESGIKKSTNKTPLEPRKKRGTKEGVKAISIKTTGPKKRAKPENNSPDEECKQPSKKKTNTMSNPN